MRAPGGLLMSRLAMSGFLEILTLVLAAWIMRRHFRDFYFNPDEISLFNGAHLGLYDILFRTAWEKHPFLGNLLRHYMVSVTSDAAQLKLLGVIPSLLTVPAAYALGRTLGRAAAVTCGTLAAVAPGLVVQGQLFRSYSLLVLAVTVAGAGFAHWVSGSRRGLGWCTAGLCVAVTTHYSGWIVALSMLTVGAAWIVRQRPGELRRGGVAAACVFGALLLCVPRLMLPTPSAELCDYFTYLVGEGRGRVLGTHAFTAVEYVFGVGSGFFVIVVTTLGAVCVWQRQRWIALQALTLFGSALALQVLHMYPLFGRQSAYLFVPYAVLMGGCVQAAAEWLTRHARRGQRVARWGGLAVSLAVLAASPNLQARVGGRNEFVLRRSEYASGWNVIDRKLAPGTVVLSDMQTAIYVLSRGGQWLDLSDGWCFVQSKGVRFLSRTSGFWALNRQKVQRMVRFARQQGFVRDRAWIMRVGWPWPDADPVDLAEHARATGAPLEEVRFGNLVLAGLATDALQ